MPSPSVIIPVFNQAPLTAQCLATVIEQWAGEIIVVDDASADNTPEVLAGLGGRIQVVRHAENLGFAVSCNDGARRATGDSLVFLNNDTIPQAGWLEALLSYSETHPEAVVVGSKLVYPNGAIQHAGVAICQDRYPRHIYAGFPADHPAVRKSRPFQIVTAACMLVKREAFAEVEGFDTAYRNGFEDVDFCLRLGELGYEVHYCAESVVQHLESVSPGRFRHDRGNVARYRQRWIERVQPDDLGYYVEDGLLQLTYEGRYPVRMAISPLLAAVDEAARTVEMETLLVERSRELAELQRENTRMRIELGGRTQDSPELKYQELRRRIREAVKDLVPAGATVLVTSKGDGALLELPGCVGWHFPQTARGAYAGHHPANSTEAVTALEELRSRGASHLLVPATCLWWLDFYPGFREHLDAHYTRLATPSDLCVIYQLGEPPETMIPATERDSAAVAAARRAWVETGVVKGKGGTQ